MSITDEQDRDEVPDPPQWHHLFRQPERSQNGKTLSDYIPERFDEFSRSQKDVARYIVDHLDEAAFLTAEELARRASTSSSTVVRFSQALGFEGYPELQQAAIEEYRHGDRRRAAPPAPAAPCSTSTTPSSRARSAPTTPTSRSTARNLTPEQVEDCVARAGHRAARRDRRRRPDGLLRQLPAPHPQPARHPRRDRHPATGGSRSASSARIDENTLVICFTAGRAHPLLCGR